MYKSCDEFTPTCSSSSCAKIGFSKQTDKVILKIDNRVIMRIPKSELIYLKNKVKITKLLNYFLKIKKAHESAFFI